MDFVKWVENIVYECAHMAVGEAFPTICDDELTELAEDIANQVELEINAQRQENKVPPIPQEILRKLDDRILYGAHPETIVSRLPVETDIDRICSMSSYELEQLRNEINPVDWRTKAVEAGWNLPESIWNEPVVKFTIPLPPKSVKPVKVWFNPPYTTVEFSDGSKVTVEQTDFEDSKFSEYAGYCCAVTKKLFGSSTAAFKRFEDAKKKAVEDSPKFKKAQARKFAKDAKALARKAKRATMEIRIKNEMDKLRIQEEAKKRLEADK